MTNEVGESTYNYGWRSLFSGSLRASFKREKTFRIHSSKRTIEKGCARMIKYLSMILPISKTDETEFLTIDRPRYDI